VIYNDRDITKKLSDKVMENLQEQCCVQYNEGGYDAED